MIRTGWRARAAALALSVLLAGPAVADEASTAFQESYALEAAYDYAGALARLDAVSRSAADAYVLDLRRGWLLYLAGRYAESVEAYRAAVRARPEAVEARLGLTLPLMALRRWKEAETTCDEVLARAPGTYNALSRRAYVLYASGRFTDAAAAYAKVVALYPADVEMRAGLGWAQLKLGRATEARATFKAVLQISPEHASAQQGLELAG